MADPIIIIEGTEANSYATLVEAQEYFDTRLNTDIWDSASEVDKAKSLIQATQMIDGLHFIGTKAENLQSLEWPRSPRVNDPYLLGIKHLMERNKEYAAWTDEEDVPIIPRDLKRACCEQALFLLTAIRGLDKRNALKTQGVYSVSHPSASDSFQERIPICPTAMRFINKLNAYEDGFRLSRE